MRNSLASIHAVGQHLTAATVCAALLLTGCAGIGPTTGRYYPECNTYCASVSTQANNVQLMKSIGVGAGAGAAGGALVGYLAGHDTKSTLIGAGVGGVLGGAAGYVYFQKKLQEYQDPRQRYQSYLQDAATQKEATLALQRDVIAARNCYDQKWKEVIAQFDRGAMSKGEAEERLREIHAGLEQVKQIIEESRASIIAQREETRKALQGERELPQAAQRQLAQSQQNLQQARQQYAARQHQSGNTNNLGGLLTDSLQNASLQTQVQQEEQNVASAQQLVNKNKKADTGRITTIERQLDNHLTEQDKSLTALYNADKDKEMRRQREASARALEV